ncbi:MAG TPA: N-acetylmuramoyl-L-alanine amidase [Gaiella sp.]|nr:N-acetylmuramoyl-L-alanine amidase [Gaiella sp.]
MLRRIALPLLIALAWPAHAAAGLASLERHELPLHGERTLSASAPMTPFQLVGIHWRGPGTLDMRTRARDGRWSAWQPVAEDEGDAPDTRSAEARATRGWRLGAPVWVGNADLVEVRVHGRVLRAEALTVRSPVSKIPLRVTAAAGAPDIVPRSGWQADESIRRAAPLYADALRMAFVHHTAGTNDYTKLQAPAVVRGIEVYHVQGNGWNDIGYNALVDRFGTVYEGRYGGIDRNVIGAHAKGFNTGSFGIAVMGNYQSVDPPQAAVDALVRTLAWRLDLGHVDPLSTLNAISSGNERFNEGIPVLLRAISGHRDTGLTECPGQRLYAMLPSIAKRVAALGLPKLYAPLATPDEGGGIRFTARLSGPLAWRVSVTDSAGAPLDGGSGTGPDVDWTWRPAGSIPPGARWRIEAPGLTPAIGTLGTQATTALQIAAAAPGPVTLTPNGDGQGDTAELAFSLTADANVGADVVDGTGAIVAQAAPLRWRRAGERTITVAGQSLADGAYTLRLTAKATGGRVATTDVPLLVTRTLGRVALDADAFTPNGDGSADTLTITVPLAAPATLTVRILRDGKWVATPLGGSFAAGDQVATWDGSKRLGRARDGDYTVSVESVDAVGTARVELPVLLDRTPPVVRVVSPEPPVLRVSEPATLAVRANGARRKLAVKTAGEVRLRGIVRLRTLVVVARDAAGNRGVLRRRP